MSQESKIKQSEKTNGETKDRRISDGGKEKREGDGTWKEPQERVRKREHGRMFSREFYGSDDNENTKKKKVKRTKGKKGERTESHNEAEEKEEEEVKGRHTKKGRQRTR